MKSQAFETVCSDNYISKVIKFVKRSKRFIKEVLYFRDTFYIQPAFKQKWIKKNKKEGGAMSYVINKSKSDEVVILCHYVKYGTRMYANVKIPEVLNLVEHQRGLYEIICKYPHKVYFDIDKKLEENTTMNPDDFLEDIMKVINDMFPDGDVAVSGNISEYKISYHIALNNYMVFDQSEKDKLKDIIHYLKSTHGDFFDTAVYNKNNALKLINQSKIPSKKDPQVRIQKIILNDKPEKHFIICFFNENAKSLKEHSFKEEIQTEVEIKSLNKGLDMSLLPKLELKLPAKFINDIDILEPIQLLRLAPINNNFDHAYTFRFMIFSYFNGITVDEYLSWYSNKSTDPNKLRYKRQIWNGLHKFDGLSGVYTKKYIYNFLCFFYKQFRKSKEQRAYDELIDTTQTPSQIINVINQSHYNIENKVIIFDIGMGSGKTEQTLRYISERKEDKVLFISPNKALTSGVYTRFKNYGLQIEHYDIDYKRRETRNKKAKCKMRSSKNLIICLNSLHYIQDNHYKILVLDELETTLEKWYDNKTLTDRFDIAEESWKQFLRTVREADKVIVLDAFISNLSLDFLKSVRADDFVLYRREKEESNRVMYIQNSFNTWLAGIIKKLKENKRCYIFYPYFKGTSKQIGIIEMKELLENETGKKGMSYYAKANDIDLKELENVNDNWHKYDFILTNSKITVGVNYDRDTPEHAFDSVFISLAGMSSPQDVIQSSCRCRHTTSTSVYVCFLEHFNTKQAFDPSCKVIHGCPIYDALIENIKKKKMAPLKSTFYALCKKAGYSIKGADGEITKELSSHITDLLDSINSCYSYERIKELREDEADEIVIKVMMQDSTMHEKISLDRYFFDMKFTSETGEEDRAFIWNKRYNFFLDALSEIYYSQDTHIFHRIAELNEWSSMLPTDHEINNVKLNDELLDKIFNEWHFAKLTKKSCHKIIVRNMFNSFFGKPIITSLKLPGKHSKLVVDDIAHEVYRICKKSLKMYKYKNISGFLDEDPFDDSFTHQVRFKDSVLLDIQENPDSCDEHDKEDIDMVKDEYGNDIKKQKVCKRKKEERMFLIN